MEKLTLRKIRYEITARRPLLMHRDLPSITIRGAFGYALLQVIARHSGINDLDDQVALFKNIFMPQTDDPEHDHEQMRPFIIRGSFSRQDHRCFLVEATLFGIAGDYEALFDEVFFTMAKMGIGTDAQPCEIEKIASELITIPDPDPQDFMILTFLTPCARIKYQAQIFRDELPFGAIVARTIDRVEELNRLYGDGVPFHSHEEIGDLKRLAQLYPHKKLSGGCYHINRISGRTGSLIRMDGFLGTMEYYGDFTPFREYLRYLPYVNLGRFNVFGCGWCLLVYSASEQ